MVDSIINDIKVYRGNNKKQLLYEQISHQLRKTIEAGMITLGQRLPTVSEMANQWKVDHRTINSALGQLEGEGLIRREKGRGKGPVVVRNVSGKYSLMFVRLTSDSFIMQITHGIEKFVKEQNVECIIVDGKNSISSFAEVACHPHVDGIIVLPSEKPQLREAIMQSLDFGAKMVFVDRVMEGINVSSISVDHVKGAYQATNHLLRTHGRPVYYLGYDADSLSSVGNRIHGWKIAMREYGYYMLKPYTRYLQMQDETAKYELHLQYDYEAALGLLKEKKEDKYCIFAMNDYVAEGVYLAAEELGMKIGEDIFIVGFGDYPLCQKLSVPLSSVYQANTQVGYEAAKLLYMMITRSVRKPVHRRISAELRIRESSAGKEGIIVESPKDADTA